MLRFPPTFEECGSLAVSAFALPLVKGQGLGWGGWVRAASFEY